MEMVPILNRRKGAITFGLCTVKQGLIIYTAIPLSANGGIFFLALRGMPFSISAGVGFIALFGVAVLNGIVLIAEFNRLRDSGMKNLSHIVLKGTKSRLRPVLMTAFVASLGFLPMAVSNGAGAEVQRPLATVVIGGLLVATFLTLFVLPLLYILFEKGFRLKYLLGKATLVALCLFMLSGATAQEKISLEDALKTAVANNKALRTEKLRAGYAEALIKTAADIPKTTIFAEAGQINSVYSDTRFGISQTIAFPTVYKRQKQLLTEEWKTSVLSASLKENEVKKMVTQVFYNVLYLKEKEKLLLQADTLFSDFYEKASLRLQKGESNVLEKATAETQKAAISVQLKQLRQELQAALLQLQVLLNTDYPVIPYAADIRAGLTAVEGSAEENVVLKLLQQQQNSAAAQTLLEKSRKLPNLTIGYFNNSFRGMAADNNFYTGSNRFSSVQLGLDIPIFTRSQNARIKAAGIAQDIAQNQYHAQLMQVQAQHKNLLAAYNSTTEIVNYFTGTGLKNALLISQVAKDQFINGEINFLDFVMLANQAIAIQGNYLDAVKALNENTIEINFITSN